MAERLIQDATQMMTTNCDAGTGSQRLQEVSLGLVRARRKTAQDKHTELERSVEQLRRHDQATGGGVRSNLEKEMELLFAEADALRQERADRLM